MLNPREEVDKLRRLKLILEEYGPVLTDDDMDNIAAGVFDYEKFVEKYPLSSKKRKPTHK